MHEVLQGHQVLAPASRDGTSTFKQGATAPVKLRVCDANGVSIGMHGVVTRFRLVAIKTGSVLVPVDRPVACSDAHLARRWAAEDRLWIFNLATRTLHKRMTYVYQVTLADGTSIDFQFGLR